MVFVANKKGSMRGVAGKDFMNKGSTYKDKTKSGSMPKGKKGKKGK